jgi:molecular chaperone GrpE (heat shock protein)
MERELEHMKQRMTRKESETRDEFDRLKTRISTLEIQLATANKENQEFREQTTRELTDLRDEFFNKIYHELPNKVCENFTVKIRDEISLALETCNFSRKLDLLMNRMAS